MPEFNRDAPLNVTPFDAQAAARRSEALFEAEVVLLDGLGQALRPVIEATPGAAALFDLAIDHGDRPRLFLDAVAFVEMGPDRSAYRFYHDLDYGCVLIAESHNMATLAKAVGNYIARRLAEAERAPAPTPAEAPPRRETAPAAIALDLFRFFLTALGAVTLIGLIALAAWVAVEHGAPT